MRTVMVPPFEVKMSILKLSYFGYFVKSRQDGTLDKLEEVVYTSNQ